VTTHLSSISPAPSAEEMAAITAAFAALDALDAAARRTARPPVEHLNLWVDTSRRSAQRAGLQRGSWRLSGRIARRARA
jgi:hypothetical protein